jgi:ABC-2 type transport system ATP-binding protein
VTATGGTTDPDAAPAIEAVDLVKRYGELRAVDGVSFTVRRGEFFGILGPNGAGKTTTLEMVEGLRRPDAGTVRLLGQSPWPRNLALLPRMGVQLQASAFFEKLSAREQLQTFGALYGVSGRRIDEMLELVGLTDVAATREDRLSGGQRQRLSIACALVHDPDVVFLDEPTAALDPQARRNLWDVIRAINQDAGKTVVLTTHYLEEAEQLCDRVAIMDSARVIALDTPAGLVASLGADVRVAYVQNGEERVTYVHDAQSAVLQLLEEARGSGSRIEGLSVRGPSLEDVFLRLTGREFRE